MCSSYLVPNANEVEKQEELCKNRASPPSHPRHIYSGNIDYTGYTCKSTKNFIRVFIKIQPSHFRLKLHVYADIVINRYTMRFALTAKHFACTMTFIITLIKTFSFFPFFLFFPPAFTSSLSTKNTVKQGIISFNSKMSYLRCLKLRLPVKSFLSEITQDVYTIT